MKLIWQYYYMCNVINVYYESSKYNILSMKKYYYYWRNVCDRKYYCWLILYWNDSIIIEIKWREANVLINDYYTSNEILLLFWLLLLLSVEKPINV